MVFLKKGCAWWLVFIIAVLTFLVGFLWGTAASSRTAESPISVNSSTVPVVTDPPRVDPVPEPVKADSTPEPVKVPEPVKTVVADPPKADSTPKVEPVDIEGISDEAWKSARIIARPSGSTMGVFLSVPTGTIVTLPIPSEWSVGDQRFVDIFVKDGGREKSEGMIFYHPEHRDGRRANQLGIVALGADQRFVPRPLTNGKVNFSVPDPRGLVFAYPGLGESAFGNLGFSFMSSQRFVEMSDKKLFVRLYLEWMARHPSRATNTDEPVDLLRWWDSLHQSAK